MCCIRFQILNKESVVNTESTGNSGKSMEIFEKIQKNRGISKKCNSKILFVHT